MRMLLVGGDEGGESCSKLSRQPGADAGVGVQQEDESSTRSRARGIWACWSRVRWHVTTHQAGVEAAMQVRQGKCDGHRAG
jgi:hypothetical protein